MRALHLLLPALLLASVPLHAQEREGTPIEQQMTREEFRNAGLEKLSAEELARLNAWLNRAVVQESRKAVAEARREDSSRGLGLFNSGEAFEARLVGRFNGFEHGRTYTLDNGQVWQQTDNARMYGVKLDNPTVQLRPGLIGSSWFMRVDNRAVNAKVKRIK